MHAYIQNGQIVAYPYTISMLRADNPNVLFPAAYNLDDAGDYGVVRVEMAARPAFDHTKNVTEATPALLAGVWTQVWVETDATAEEIASRTAAQEGRMRAERNNALAACDWTQLADAPVDQEAWAAYRQALRDLPSTAGWPWDVTMPPMPGAT